MTHDEFLDEYRQAVEDQAKAEARVKVLELQAQLLLKSSPPPVPEQKSKTQTFIEQYGHLIDEDDTEAFELLEKRSRPTTEIASYLEVHKNQIAKWLKDGRYRPGIGDTPRKRMVDTQSVIEYVYQIKPDAKAKGKSKRNL